MADNSLHKKERLKSRKHIDMLFSDGESAYKYPIKCVYLREQDIDVPVKAAFTVPKRVFKRAVDRNLLKRRLRESYRTNKHLIPLKKSDQGKGIILMLIYVSKDIENSTVIEKSMIQLFQQLKP